MTWTGMHLFLVVNMGSYLTLKWIKVWEKIA